MKKTDQAKFVAKGVASEVDADKLVKGLVNPLVMNFLGIWLVKRHLGRLTHLSVTFSTAWSVVHLLSWLAYFLSRNWTQGRLHAEQAFKIADSGFVKDKPKQAVKPTTANSGAASTFKVTGTGGLFS